MSTGHDSNVKTTRENWFEEHPQYLKIKSFGYEDESRLRTAMLVYLDLIEAKHWFDVDVHRCDALQCVFIVGRPLKKCQMEIVVPLTSFDSVSHEDIHRVLHEVGKNIEKYVLNVCGVDHAVHFAIMESNSTVVYYKISNGLVPPDEVGDDDPDADSKIRWKKKPNKTRN